MQRFVSARRTCRLPSVYRSMIAAPRFYSNASDGHHDSDYGSVAQYEEKWIQHFDNCPDLFELQRGLNNCFAYDIVPTGPVLEAALLASRRLNSLSLPVRILLGLRGKVENPQQYNQYVQQFQPLLKELGVPTPEELQL